MRDYAALIADEAIRRTSTEVGYAGYYTLLTALAQAASQPASLNAETAAALRSGPNDRLRLAAVLARSVFLLERGAHGIEFFGEPPAPEARTELIEHLTLAAAHDIPIAVFRGSLGGAHTFVSTSAHGPRGNALSVGFELDPRALDSWPDLGVVKPFGDVYQGALEGFTAEASIDPGAAAELVIGGLPRSRLPFFLGLLTVIAGLTVTAILQLRREMTLTRLRSEFVSGVSHELRTPLTQIRVFAETLLLERIRTPEEHRRALEIIDREARRLTHRFTVRATPGSLGLLAGGG